MDKDDDVDDAVVSVVVNADGMPEVDVVTVIATIDASCLFCCVSIVVVGVVVVDDVVVLVGAVVVVLVVDDGRLCCGCSLACQPIMISSEFMIDPEQEREKIVTTD